jgi:hypothetical protein
MTNYQLADLLHTIIGRVHLSDLERITRLERESWERVHTQGNTPDDKTMGACLVAVNNMLDYDKYQIEKALERNYK